MPVLGQETGDQTPEAPVIFDDQEMHSAVVAQVPESPLKVSGGSDVRSRS
jgi:hypothetical protein